MNTFENIHVLYINLDYRIDRNEHIKKELEKLGIIETRIERFNAIKMSNGAVGCTMSHIKCMELAKLRNWSKVMICEDDAVFSQPDVLNTSMKKFAESNLAWDVLLIGANNVPPYEKIGDYCIRVSNAQTTTCYMVSSHYYDTLIRNFREGVSKLLRDPTNKREWAIDMYWKRLQGIDRWYMLTPPTVYQKEDYSDIEGRAVDYRHLMLDLDKPWLFQRIENKPKKMNMIHS
jgi:glycosyl transferase family 25